MELLQLAQFKAIAETGNMTRAARELHVSQPTLSAMLKRLERELGLALFSRERNRLVLTEAGRILLKHAAIILEAEQDARDALERFRQRETELLVGFCDPGPLWVLPPPPLHDAAGEAHADRGVLRPGARCKPPHRPDL